MNEALVKWLKRRNQRNTFRHSDLRVLQMINAKILFPIIRSSFFFEYDTSYQKLRKNDNDYDTQKQNNII